MASRPPHPLQSLVYGLEIKLFRVKLLTGPSREMVKFLVSRLEDDLQEFLVPMWPSDIFRWAAPFTGKADRLCCPGI
jgi:hypothetical protein